MQQPVAAWQTLSLRPRKIERPSGRSLQWRQSGETKKAHLGRVSCRGEAGEAPCYTITGSNKMQPEGLERSRCRLDAMAGSAVRVISPPGGKA